MAGAAPAHICASLSPSWQERLLGEMLPVSTVGGQLESSQAKNLGETVTLRVGDTLASGLGCPEHRSWGEKRL